MGSYCIITVGLVTSETTTTLASGFPEAPSNDRLIIDTKSRGKQRETLEDAEGQARMVQSCVARIAVAPRL